MNAILEYFASNIATLDDCANDLEFELHYVKEVGEQLIERGELVHMGTVVDFRGKVMDFYHLKTE